MADTLQHQLLSRPLESMFSNGTSAAGFGFDSQSDDHILKLTIAAFAISTAALGVSILQAFLVHLQADGEGRRRCSEELMGKEWAAKTTRTYKWSEFRYQVFFEVPVFYTAPPGITVGPITLTKPKVTIQSTISRLFQSSKPKYKNVKEPFDDRAKEMEVVDLVPHVAPIIKITGTEESYKNTMTSLPDKKNEKWANVHTAEDEGCSWVLLLDALQTQERVSRAWDKVPNNPRVEHTICCLIQRKRRCWDFMPRNATKPFATTTICHLVEIMAMLGLVWTEFDLKASNLSAEGNGYMVKSEYLQGLGILSRFSRLTRPAHEGNRIIPCNEIKRLCFGEVPSLFDDDRQKLQVGPGRLETSLMHLLPDLTDEHRAFFLQPGENDTHSTITPTFQLIAMVARSAHIKGSRFRRLPNPCGDVPPRGLNIAACLRAFATKIKHHRELGNDSLTQEIWNSFEKGRFDGSTLDASEGCTLEQLIHRYITATNNLKNEQDEMALAPSGPREALNSAESRYNDALLRLLDALHTAVVKVDERMKFNFRKEMHKVVAKHFATVFEKRDELKSKLAQARSKEDTLVAFYFDSVRPAVVSHKSASSTTSGSPGGPALQRETEEMQRSAVWLALMFKMWSWLFLHEFNPLDRMIERTEFFNSRLPVYIG